jgi:signal transduction histidine kinase
MEFILLFSISLIPLIFGIVILFNTRNSLTVGIFSFLLLLSLWQIDIAILYSQKVLTKMTIDFLFRIFRVGTIMIMPLMYYFAYYVKKKVVQTPTYNKLVSFLINKHGLYLMSFIGIIVYLINFTEYGILDVRFNTNNWLSHYYPVYGSLSLAFSICVLFIFVNTVLLFVTCLSVSDKLLRNFFKWLVFSTFFIFINGLLSGFLYIPLFFSSLSSVFATIVLFICYLSMHIQTINKMNTELTNQSSFLETLINVSPNFIYVKNNRDDLVLVNNACLDLFDLNPINFMEMNEKSIIEKMSFVEGEPKTVRNVKNSQEENHIVEWASVAVKFKGEQDYMLHLGFDVTERTETEKLLVKSENLRVIGEMAAGIAHEIKNPLTSIKGFIDLIKENEAGMNQNFYLNIVSDEIDRIADVTDELLFMAKPQVSMDEDTSFDILKVINDVNTLLASSAELKNASVTLINKEELICRGIDKNVIKQILINIIKNAIDAISNEGMIKLKVEMVGKNKFRIRMIDNGIGISKKDLKRLGEPFYTTKNKGTGLGLTVCYKMAREQNGEVIIRSKEKWGTVVDLYLPLIS